MATAAKDTPSKDLLKWVKSEDPLSNRKFFLKLLSPDEIRLYGLFIEQIRADTGNALTEAEYEQLAIIRFWLDKYDAWASPLTPDKIPATVAEVARKYRTMLLEALERERRATRKPSDILEGAKRFILELEREGGGKIKIEASRPKVVDAIASEGSDADGGSAQKN